MTPSFEKDKFPGAPRILFIGQAESSHTRAWIDLLEHAEINVRLFSLPSGTPPDDWPVRTYLTAIRDKKNTATRRVLLPMIPGRIRGSASFRVRVNRLLTGKRWLARVIRRWRPHVIHTLGLDLGGKYYHDVRGRFELEGIGKWVLQLRGGSDLTLDRLSPDESALKASIVRKVDYLISDNEQNFQYLAAMGVDLDGVGKFGPVPGTGGVDLATLENSWFGRPSARRIILWPKAYESIWSIGLPVLEALKLAWQNLGEFEIHMLATGPKIDRWYWTLPEGLRDNCHRYGRIPREQVLELMLKSRAMLAPSLVDGTPNTMFEAMACGALPIVSPLDTIVPIVESRRNVLFARNLYPEEIATALVSAMSDDELVESAAAANLDLVRRIADRASISPRVLKFYLEII